MGLMKMRFTDPLGGLNYRPRSEGDNVLGSVRPSVFSLTVKSNKNHYQSKVFVCVSIISGRMRIIARMRSIGF